MLSASNTSVNYAARMRERGRPILKLEAILVTNEPWEFLAEQYSSRTGPKTS